ncbi:MAG: ATP-binding cassette domain-containing protein [Candidatus Omnitrophica bacterium]|nr:ATP-binding cassette domain-containing protein [Candidatus Omnitrophota bacterium]MDE2008917.1 ATP-binding cassette domain-containing protein [Candidatus Omnitrophota bacterium]MDE2213520.1 ATP-binding cassette domain-containing protein [Candidatus Omnitrophota bacterium]MDE2230579.1 ATP-binding cassette domain-containing protein [Candidatus Omnitrophota bacterium]
MKKENIITVNNLSAGYFLGKSKRMVFEQTSFAIAKGEFVGILGPNGAGKTTLFKLLLGLLKPISGEITVFGRKPQCDNDRIGYVPQHHSFDAELRIEALEIVKLGTSGKRLGFSLPAQSKKETKASLKALDIVGAQELAHRSLSTLSGGELQRIFLAQALVGNPQILLLDEPLASLDIRRESEFVKLIKDVATSQNITVLLIAHNINPLLSALDRVVYVANGHVAVGDPGDVLNSEALTKLYNSPVEVLRDSRGRFAIVGGEVGEEGAHHHEH